MSEWPDEKIRPTALGYINKHVMNPLAWRATSVGEIHPKLTVLAELKSDELPIVSCFHSMAPIYYFRFWTAKYPLLTKLKS